MSAIDHTFMTQASQSSMPETQLFRDVFNASPIGIVVENLDGQPLFVNPAFCSMLGFSEEEIRGKHCVDFSPPEDAAKDWELFQQLRAGAIDHYQLEKRYFRRDGSLVWGSLSISLLTSRPSPLVIAMVADITDKKRAEEARFRHAAIVESSEDAIASVTLDGVIVSWNAGAEYIYGYTEAEAVGNSVNILVPPELLDEEKAILETLRAGGRIEHFETLRVTKTGKRVNVSLSISPIKDASGKIIGLTGMARDISELKRHEQDLRTSEERLRLAQQAARIGAFEWNIQTGVDTWTPELESIHGLPPGGFAGTQTAWEDLLHPDDRLRVVELAKQSMKTGMPMQGEWRIVWPDGSTHWIAGRWRVLMNGAGEPSRMVGVNLDVTDRKRSEERLREYEKAVEGAEDLIGVIDREYRFLLANRQYLKMRNLTREQVVGHFIPEVLDREVFETIVKPKLDECFQGKVVKYEAKFSYPAIGERDLLLSYFPIEGVNGVDRAACILRDITDRKRAEEALRESEEKFRSVFRNAGVGMVIVSPEGRFLAANATFCDCLGYTEEELLAKTVESVTFPEDWPALSQRLGEAVTEGNGLWRFEKRCLHKSGRIVYTESSASLIRNRNGEPQYLVGEVLDVTKRKESEKILSDMTRKLVEAQEQERARIARELHDDINQRLALLAIKLSQLQEHPTEVTSRLRELREEVDHIAGDVQSLSYDLHSSKLEYLGVVAGIKSWCKDFAERQKIEIDFSSGVHRILPLEVGLTLFRVLQEALHNAIKHSGVKHVEVQLREDYGEIHLVVADLCKGFDPEAALRGRGLGLVSMRERVRLVNGTIAIKSRPMGGTTIHISIPLEPDQTLQRAVG